MEIEWDLEQYIFNIWGLKKKQKFPLFAFVCQCLSRNLPQIDLNRIINYYTRKFRKNWDQKWNVECDIVENFKAD
jgi:hypothetical protein